ncbi:MAG: hypothetical protein QM473_13145 [Acidobacteriota bacterium]|jgi:hypothetical protein|nr:hypothetical protein [Acidobacteriota bacterium]
MTIASEITTATTSTAVETSRTGAITPRAIAIAFILVIAFTVAGCFSVLLRYEIIGTGYLPRGAVALLLALIAGNAVLRGLKSMRIKPLGAQELMLIFLLLMVVGAIAGQEFAQHFYLKLVGLVYYATPDIAPPDLYLDKLNPMLLPDTDPEGVVARWAHEGLPPGQVMPWRAWVRPLLIWTPFFLAMYWMVLCFAATMAWRWEQEEKLLYPLVQVPVEIVQGEPSAASSMLRDRLVWVAFILPCIHYTLQGLHGYWPEIPFINLEQDLKVRFTGPLAAFNGILLYMRMDMIGIAYLLSSEVSFSLWFFYLFRRIQLFTRLAFGITSNSNPFFTLQTTGGYIVLAAALLYSAREHLRRALAIAFGLVRRAPDEPDAQEPYRLAVFGFLGAFVFLVWWCSYFGMNTVWAVAQYVFFPLVGMVVARVICEAGMFVYSAPIGGYTAGYNEALFTLFGVRRIGTMNVTLMTMTSWCQIRSTATQNSASVFQGYRIGSEMGARRGDIMLLSIAAVALALIACHITAPWIIYNYGAPKLADWPSRAGLDSTRGLVNLLQKPTTMLLGDWMSLGLGAVTTWALFALRRQFIWWPLHPLGFVTWLSWPIDRYWVAVFIGWLLKTAVLRFGGFRTFRRLRPVAFGLVLGMNVIFTIWLIVHMIWPGPPAILVD